MSRRLAHILALHLHPELGSRYWRETERELGFSICRRVQSLDDLHELGPFDEQALCTRPIEDFIPRSMHGGHKLFTGETGGATGRPKTVAYSASDFRAAFIDPFLSCVDCETIFTGGHWLWLGPSGPHIIGKVARQIAWETTGSDGFSVDFDPRWYRRLTSGSISRTRYLDHVLEQAERIAGQQDVRYLFCTPVVLDGLAKRLSERTRQAIRFVYLGGMAIEPGMHAALGELFPAAEFLCGYGNTLFGVTHEARAGRPNNEKRCYYPTSDRLIIRLVSRDETLSAMARLKTDVTCGQTGQVVMHRLDESCFLANVMERDQAVRVRSDGPGESVDGIRDPRPIEIDGFKVDDGIY